MLSLSHYIYCLTSDERALYIRVRTWELTIPYNVIHNLANRFLLLADLRILVISGKQPLGYIIKGRGTSEYNRQLSTKARSLPK